MAHARARLLQASTAAAALPLAAVLCAAPPASALEPVPPRSVLEVNRIDSPVSTAVPDGRVLLGWTNGTNDGDTTNAQVRPAGGVLPATYQALRTGFSSESLAFVPGGPADDPVITVFEDSDSRSPFRVQLTGDLFTTQSAVLSGMYSTGRFPTYARCADGTTVFGYQFTDTAVSPASYSTMAQLADAHGKLSGGGFFSSPSADTFQQPTVTCDRNTPIVSVADDPDADGPLGEKLQVRAIGAGGGTLLTRTTAPGASAQTPDARVAPDGRVWIIWREHTGTSQTYVSTRAPGVAGLASAPVVFDPTGSTEDLFFDAAGNTHVLLEHENGDDTSYGIRTAAPGSATFGPEQVLLPAADQSVRLLTDHPDGNPRLLVRTSAPTGGLASYALRGIPQAGSGSISTPLGVSVRGFSTASFLPSGDLFFASSNELGPERVELVEGGLDTGAPPTLTGVQVPSLAAPGEAIPIAIDARDPLGLSAFSWTVDGQTLTQQDTTLKLPRAGTFVVTARAVDRAGHATELTRTIRVLDPAALTPGTPEFAAAAAALVGKPAPVPAADTTAPKLVKSTATRGRKGAAKRKVTVQLTSSEAASADVELIGTLKRGKEQGRLTLKSARIASLAADRSASTTLTVPTALTKLVKGKLSVRVTLTDLSGNRTVATVPVKTAKK